MELCLLKSDSLPTLVSAAHNSVFYLLSVVFLTVCVFVDLLIELLDLMQTDVGGSLPTDLGRLTLLGKAYAETWVKPLLLFRSDSFLAAFDIAHQERFVQPSTGSREASRQKLASYRVSRSFISFTTFFLERFHPNWAVSLI